MHVNESLALRECLSYLRSRMFKVTSVEEYEELKDTIIKVTGFLKLVNDDKPFELPEVI